MKSLYSLSLVLLFCLLPTWLAANTNHKMVDDDHKKIQQRGLYVEGSKKFKLKVLRHLQRLTNYQLDMFLLSGKLVIKGISYEGKQKDKGNNLIKKLVYADRRIVIKYAREKHNRFVANSHTKMILNQPVGGTVYYYPKSQSGGLNIFNSKARPPYIGLAHELIHGLHAVTGMAEMAFVDGDCLGYENELTQEEHNTRVEENKIRAELGVSPRKIPIRNLSCLGNEALVKDLEQLFGRMAL